MWTVYDFGTTPYLFYLTDLLPTAQGIPVFTASILGLVWAVRRRTWDAVFLLAWVVPYFIVRRRSVHETRAITHCPCFRHSPSSLRGCASALGHRLAGTSHLRAIPAIFLLALTVTAHTPVEMSAPHLCLGHHTHRPRHRFFRELALSAKMRRRVHYNNAVRPGWWG